MSEAPLEISIQELKAALDRGDDLVVLDVREPWELGRASLPGTLNIPMNEIPDRLAEVPDDRRVAVLCRSGGRSMQVTNYLRGHGYGMTSNITGGIMAWADQIDPSMTRY